MSAGIPSVPFSTEKTLSGHKRTDSHLDPALTNTFKLKQASTFREEDQLDPQDVMSNRGRLQWLSEGKETPGASAVALGSSSVSLKPWD
ncbi:hypothetical protein DNTS_033614 [Danionella cerebrum]|uniref:Uncharacterized protein n=1 Tax=Danionella cerebrum TaxID=2873325 RepID=A0A553RC37_9TELE|nr:hypothetical protein DNTS_033614 [Danionella translucida]